MSENDEVDQESGSRSDRVSDRGSDRDTAIESDGHSSSGHSNADPSALLPKYLFEGLQKQDVERLRVAREFIDRLIEEKERPVDRDELPDTAEPISETQAGYVVEELVQCGKDNCKCASGAEAEMHGPYKYRYYRDETGTLQKEYADND